MSSQVQENVANDPMAASFEKASAKNSTQAEPVVKQTIELQRRMLAKTKTEKKNHLSMTNKFDAVGSNGLFGAYPSTVKFAGFELCKTHTLKVKLINNSPAPQRLHILPPQTPYFKIKYNKKGMIPSGISEDIYVQFTPNDEYKYFYDSIRIHCEGDKILIPIHAFPVINSKKDELVPKSIDLGRACKVGQTYQKTVKIESNCPMAFEYEIKETKVHPDIKVTPIVGDIIGNSETNLTFIYNPSTFTTAEAEFEFRTSEFDFTPQMIRIVGSALPQRVPAQQNFYPIEAIEEEEDQYSQNGSTVIKRKNRTLLTDKSSRPQRGGQGKQLDKIPEQSFKKKGTASGVNAGTIGSQDDTQIQEKLKSMKLTGEELTFLKSYRTLEDLEREKGIKFFECIGDPPATAEFVGGVETKRQNFITNKENSMRDRDTNRFATVVNADKVVVPTNIKLVEQPQWDMFKNNHFAMRKRLVTIFLKVANKLIIRMRAGKRLTKIKKRIIEMGVNNREDMKKMVAEDAKAAMNLRQENAEEETDNIMNVGFKFSFDKKKVHTDIKMPLEYETNIASFMEKIDAQPVINFDDLVNFDAIEQLDFEVEKYAPFQLPPASTYDPVFNDKQYRPGCEYESTIRQIAGEPDLEKIQQAAHDQMELLKQNKKEIVSGANVAMVASFLKPLDYSIDLLVRNHPTLREYCQQVDSTEVDPQFNIYPYKRDRIMPKDEIQLRNAKKEAEKTFVQSLSKSISGSFINTLEVPTYDLPGNFGVRIAETMPMNLRNVHIDQRNNIDLGFICDNRLSHIPQVLEKPDQNDYLTDEESDEGADFEVKVPELDQLIDQFELEDEIVQEQKVSIKNYKKDQITRGFEPEDRHEIINDKGNRKQMLDDNISKQREQQIALLPGQMQDLNEKIVNRANKAYLR